MKIRNGFVSNSSSSSFIITDADHPGIQILLAHPDQVEVDLDLGEVYDVDDNGTWNVLGDADYDWDDFLEQTSFSG